MKTIELSGYWHLEQAGKEGPVPCFIPGDNITALRNADIIPDPFCGRNELSVQWVGREAWVFSTEFIAEAGFSLSPNIVLEMEFIDTFAEIKLNGKTAGFSSNMFKKCRIQLGGLVKEGTNRLEVIISSAEKKAEEIAAGLPYPVPHSVYPVQSHGRNLVRKTQCHSGWDWGPCLMVSGIYGETVVKASAAEIIECVHCRILPRDGDLRSWTVDITVELDSPGGGSTEITAECAGTSASTSVKLTGGRQTASLCLDIESPELWWPAGYGKQPLYDLTVKTVNDSAVKKIGFRQAEVLTRQDEKGTGMVFRINGRDVFCKGANWIPADALPAAHTEERYRHLIGSAAAANMNMLRVWGGGQYEKDIFYELCDEHGIMVWQDFMFSCSTYPSDAEFLKSVRLEAEYQVKRLKDHPSLVLWCGNNEDIGALTWFPESRENRDRYIIDYDRLNEGVLADTVKRLDPDRKWWSSSPSAGEGDYSDCWHDDTKGDMHYWSVWHEGKPFEAYKEVTPRFCSEFGFQSLPSLDTIKGFAREEDLNLTSPVMEHHQRNERGNDIIISTIARYFRFPSGFGETVYLSMVQQAMAIKTAVEYWRSRRPVCMGSLYWQLNDTWPVASWSSLEYDGSWKPLHYSAKRFFAPLLLTLQDNSNGEIEVYLCNDTDKEIRGTLYIELFDFNGQLKRMIDLKTSALPDSSVMTEKAPIPHLEDIRSECFYYARFIPDDAEISGCENFLLLDKPKRCNIGDAGFNITVGGKPGCISVKIDSCRPAFFTVLELPEINCRFSDSNLTIIPGRPVTVDIINGPEDLTPGSVEKALRIHSLRNYGGGRPACN